MRYKKCEDRKDRCSEDIKQNKKKYRVVFDVDDTLNNLYETAYRGLNLLHKLAVKKRYYLKDCDELTEREKDEVLSAFKDPDIYLACKAHKGIEKIDKLSARDDVEVIIHSYTRGSKC